MHTVKKSMRLIHRRLWWASTLAGVFSACAHAAAPLPDSERAVLLELYDSTNGGQWLRHDFWGGPPGSECDIDNPWWGVQCRLGVDGFNHVADLFFEANGLSGVLPADLASLTGLEQFDVRFNALTGSLPSLDGLTNLVLFWASANLFTGPIPALAGLSSLEQFDVASNNLSGPIPPLDSLPELSIVSLSSNNLDGPIPSLANLPKLFSFGAASNRLSGSIPALGSVKFFAVHSNKLDGQIPSLAAYTLLAGFDVHSNQLSGSIPALAGLTNLKTFDVSNNQLTGSIPPLDMTGINRFLAGANQLTGPVSTPSPVPIPGISNNNLCPNPLDLTPNVNDAGWNTATNLHPWWGAFHSQCDILFRNGF